MMDIKFSSLMPEWRQASLPHKNFPKQTPSHVTSWFMAMRGPIPVPVNIRPDFPPKSSSPWGRLMASSPLQSHSLAASTASKFTHREGALMSSLLEFAPCLGKYHPIGSTSVHGHDLEESTNTQSPYILTSVTLAFQPPFIAISLPPTLVVTPVIPTIVVTDVDGPLPSGINDSCHDRLYRSETCGLGLLWSQWRGKFSPSRCGSEFGSGNGVYLEDLPEEDIEGETEDDNEDCFKGHDSITLDAREQCRVTIPTSEEPRPIKQVPKELEWWEIEGGDDGSGDDDSEDESDDESDEDEDEDNEDQESDYEGEDDENEDDSNDDDSGEDSDLGESESNKTILALGNPPLNPGTLVPYPYQKPGSAITHANTEDVGLFDRDTQDTEGSYGLFLTCLDLESRSSCTTISSQSPTPIICSSPRVLPVGNICLIGDKEIIRRLSRPSNYGSCWRGDNYSI